MLQKTQSLWQKNTWTVQSGSWRESHDSHLLQNLHPEKSWRQSEIQLQRVKLSHPKRTISLLPTCTPNGPDKIVHQPRIQNLGQHHLHLPTEQRRIILLYCKCEVMDNGVHTKPLNITLTPRPPWEVDIVDHNHQWELEKEHGFCIEGKISNTTLAEICLVKPDALESIILQLPRHAPKGTVIFPLKSSLKKKHDKWKHDTYWTMGLSAKSSLLRLCTPGQNKLGEMMKRIMLTRAMEQNHLRDHDYL